MNKQHPETSVSTYDQVNGILAATILVMGFVVLALFVIWLTMGEQLFSRTWTPLPPTTNDPKLPAQPDNTALLDSDDFKQTTEPGLDLKLTLVQNLASEVHAKVAVSGTGNSLGKDKRRGPNPIDIPGELEAALRWQVFFAAQDSREYADQLDYFGIEIGALDAESEKIVVLSSLGGATQSHDSDRQAQSNRLYFVHRQSKMQRWESHFAKKAGVSFDNLITCQFFPKALQNEMARLELEAALEAGREIDDVIQTRFEIKSIPSGYKIIVSEINFSNTLDN